MDRQDLGWAAFALGRFVQYRLDEGMAPEDLALCMKAYFNLAAHLDGREPLCPAERQAQIAAAVQAAREADRRGWPCWLQPHEQWRQSLPAPCSSLSSEDPDARLQSDGSWRGHLRASG